jgi:hydrophobic/amphiphilic exporter-1 (mainly G- bacteria), HAE1 family
MEILEKDVIAPLAAEGLPAGVGIRMSGTADNPTEAWNIMRLDPIIAVAIVYLVMAVLFESFLYPLIIMLSVPLATAGGIGGLAVLNLFRHQPLDMLALLGFIILVGIVVNNAILLVHQTLYQLRQEGRPLEEAIVVATRNRIRPIFMSTLTSIFGMLPVVVFPGAGSALYRGLGSAVLGGPALSAVRTLAIIRSLLSLVVGSAERHRAPATAPVPQPAEERRARGVDCGLAASPIRSYIKKDEYGRGRRRGRAPGRVAGREAWTIACVSSSTTRGRPAPCSRR